MHKDTNACGAPLTCLTVSKYCGQEYMVMHKDTNACGAPLTCLTVSRYCGQEYMVMHKNNLLDDCGHLPEER